MRKHFLKEDGMPAMPMLQLFAGLIGVLILIAFLVAIKAQQVKSEQIDPENIVGIQTVDLSVNPQIKLLLFPDYVQVQETGEKIPLASLFQGNNRLVQYLSQHQRAIYSGQSDLYLMLYPDSNRTMFAVRQLLVQIRVARFNLLLLNDELMQQLLSAGK
jgi:hypothetical protein